MSDHDSSEDIERDIERTRADIDRTLSDLQHKLSPNALINEALASARVKTALRSAGSGTANFAASLGRTMSSHPIPVLLTAVGVAWLAFSARSSANGGRKRELSSSETSQVPTAAHVEAEPAGREDPSRGPRYEAVGDPTLHAGVAAGAGHGSSGGRGLSGDGGASGGRPPDTRTDAEVTEELMAEAAKRGGRQPDTRTDAEVTEELKAEAARRRSGIGQRARGAAASISGRVGRVSETLSRGVGRMTGVIKESGAGAYESTRGVTGRATHAVRQVPARIGGAYQSAGSFIQENPIISGALAVALGAALALMIPASRRERKLVGEASDEVKASVRETVEETVDRAKEAVRTATEAAADAARKEMTKGREAAGGKAGERAEERPSSAADFPGTVGDVGRPAASSGIDIAAEARPTTEEPTATVGPTEELTTRRTSREERIEGEKV
jgi:Protein of unknown function (DUF3618)